VENESIWGLRSKGKHPYGKSFYKGQKYHGYDAPQRVAKNVTQDLSDHAKEWLEKTVKEDPDNPFFLYFCPVAVHHPISPSDKFSGTSGIGAYGDFIHDLDNSVGEIINKLESLGVLDDTLFIFTSDNGGDFCPEEQEARALGFKVNGDIKGDKHLIWQGGFKVPLVARWPKMIKAGSQSDRMVNTVDLYATFQELLDGKVMDPETAAPDSFSFYPELVGKASKKQPRESMVQNDVRGIVAIRMGDWKYIENQPERPSDKARYKKNPKLARPELYNLKKDPAETESVIQQYPEVAEKMQKALDRIRDKGSERIAVKG
jgi:arylsulfatase A